VSTVLRITSRILCLIVIASFALFAIEQTSSASTHQQNELSGGPSTPSSSTQDSHKHKSAVHRTIDEVSSTLTSPFSGITTGWHSEWAVRCVTLLLALLVYGFGLGFLARVVRVRV
jgi:hypothetical protein